ncbi:MULTISPECIES: RHS repeat-associated core domain-containing protein [Chitinophagaceae]
MRTYYTAFGLTMAGTSSQQSSPVLANKDKTFQGQKFDDDLGLNWVEFKYHNHDPQIGRFIEIDPLSDKYVYNSTYAFSENKVTGAVELEGLEILPINSAWFRIYAQQSSGNRWTQNVSVVASNVPSIFKDKKGNPLFSAGRHQH